MVVVLDNLCNCQTDVIAYVENITGYFVHFLLGDVGDRVLPSSFF
jgi:UDP-glucose 4-epimerase